MGIQHHDTIMNVFPEYIEKYVNDVDCGPDFPSILRMKNFV